jgi:tripartite-type tricarboxylate transporter receptor subunit TctC
LHHVEALQSKVQTAMRSGTRWCVLAASLLLVAPALAPDRAPAQSYPTRPVTMIVPFAAGGSTDSIARIVADGMATSLGQAVVIENVGGASGSLGVDRAIRAAPDGYSVCLGSWASHVVAAAIHSAQYDVVNDFAAVSLIASNPMIIVARKGLPANDLNALVGWLKANPGQALLGTAGPGSASNLAGAFFEKQTGTAFHRVPYRGLGLAMQDLVAGRIDVIIDLAANALPQVHAGTVKAYAVTAGTRLAAAPDIPTVDEVGLAGLHMAVWQGLWAPKGTPQAIIDRLDAAVVDALADPRARQRLVDLGQDIYPRAQQTPAALRALHQAEVDKWWPIVKAASTKTN